MVNECCWVGFQAVVTEAYSKRWKASKETLAEKQEVCVLSMFEEASLLDTIPLGWEKCLSQWEDPFTRPRQVSARRKTLAQYLPSSWCMAFIRNLR